jgi:CDP-L-myo-inositol myo-inositolphosphotransferase
MLPFDFAARCDESAANDLQADTIDAGARTGEKDVLLAVVFQGDALELQIAGMPACARFVAEAHRAGISEVWVSSTGPEPSEAAWAEMDRAAAGGRVAWVEQDQLEKGIASQPRAVLLACGAWLPTAGALRRFLDSVAKELRSGDLPVILKCRSGLQPVASEPVIEAALPGDLIDLRDRRSASREILKNTAKPSDGLISRRINRPISQRISALLLTMSGIRPVHMTAVTAAVAAAMFAALASRTFAGLVAGGILFQLASLLDGVDGEIARATFRASRSGAVLDSAVDMSTNLLFYFGLTVALARLYGTVWLVLGALCVSFALAGILLLGGLAWHQGRPGDYDLLKAHYRTRFAEGTPRRILETLIVLSSRDSFAFASAVMICTGFARVDQICLTAFAIFWFLSVAAAAPALLRSRGAGAGRGKLLLTPPLPKAGSVD